LYNYKFLYKNELSQKDVWLYLAKAYFI